MSEHLAYLRFSLETEDYDVEKLKKLQRELVDLLGPAQEQDSLVVDDEGWGNAQMLLDVLSELTDVAFRPEPKVAG